MHTPDARSMAGSVSSRPPGIHIVTDAAELAPAGGIEVCTVQDSAALSARGHRVDVLFGRDGPDRAEYARAGIDVHGPFAFGFDPRRALGDLRSFRPAARAVAALKPDVLWLNRPEHLVWAQWVARAARVPIVCHLHHAPNYRRVRLLSAGVGHFLAVSDYERGEWIRAGLQRERVSVLHNALPPGRYPSGTGAERTAARAALGLPSGVPIALFYGRLTAAKGAQTLIEAWRRLGPAREEAVLVLLGPTPAAEEREVSAALARLPAGTWRRFPSRPDVVAFLHAADVVVVPSTVPESFGRAVLEGMATGRPVLASRIGAIPEILSGAMSRFLVSPGSPAELAERLSSLLHWRRLEPGLGQACADWAAARFPHAVHIEGLERVLLTARRGPANHG